MGGFRAQGSGFRDEVTPSAQGPNSPSPCAAPAAGGGRGRGMEVPKWFNYAQRGQSESAVNNPGTERNSLAAISGCRSSAVTMEFVPRFPSPGLRRSA